MAALKSTPLFEQIAAAVKEDGKTLVGKVNGVIQVRAPRGSTETSTLAGTLATVPRANAHPQMMLPGIDCAYFALFFTNIAFSPLFWHVRRPGCR